MEKFTPHNCPQLESFKKTHGVEVIFGLCPAIELASLLEFEHAHYKWMIDELKKYFTSGNEIPVERATILAKDFWKIVQYSEENEKKILAAMDADIYNRPAAVWKRERADDTEDKE